MEGNQFEVGIYRTEEGKRPFADWSLSLKDRKARVKIDTRINRLQLGNLGDCKNVGGGVFELRVDYGPGYRVYFGRRGQKLIILLCGGDKRTQQRDIQRAKQYWEEYKDGN